VGAIGAGTGNLDAQIRFGQTEIASDAWFIRLSKDVHEPRCKGRSSIVIVVARGNFCPMIAALTTEREPFIGRRHRPTRQWLGPWDRS
jgi:hypothetical protein